MHLVRQCLVSQCLHSYSFSNLCASMHTDSAALVLYSVYNTCTCWLTLLP